MTTFAPDARQAWACAFCFVGSFSALLIDAVTPAFLKAALNAGASNCTQRTEDFVSGSRTQTWTLALCDAPAPATTPTAATETTSKAAALRMFLLTCISFVSSCQGISGIAGSLTERTCTLRAALSGAGVLQKPLANTTQSQIETFSSLDRGPM